MRIITANVTGIVVFLAVLAILAPVSAAAGQEPAVMPLLRKNYGGTRAVNAAFDLSIYWSVREREEKKSGEMHSAPGDRFRVSLGKDVFVSDGKTFWQYNERNAQVVVRDFSDIDPATIPSALLSSFLLTRKFEGAKQDDGTIHLSWRGDGTAAGDGYKEVNAFVHEKSGVINVLKLMDGNDNIHTYTFKKTEFDKPSKNDAYQFKTPRGVEVVDMR